MSWHQNVDQPLVALITFSCVWEQYKSTISLISMCWKCIEWFNRVMSVCHHTMKWRIYWQQWYWKKGLKNKLWLVVKQVCQKYLLITWSVLPAAVNEPRNRKNNLHIELKGHVWDLHIPVHGCDIQYIYIYIYTLSTSNFHPNPTRAQKKICCAF